MIAWPSPHVPEVPGRGTAPRLHDTAGGGRTSPAPGPVAGMYVCGITPYDATHLGHAATYIGFDLLARTWRDAGLEVRYVQNVTDVDDPLLERAAATGVDWRDLAADQMALFAEDMTALGVLAPDLYLGAVETIPLVVDAVERLEALGAAYRVAPEAGREQGEQGDDVYFDVRSDARFGGVSGWDRPTMLAVFSERGGDPDRAGKRDPLDPVLWRAARAGEPSWDGRSLGHGRPGWHVECVAIALTELHRPFDVQGGGSDLVFPHHEMGASHAHVLTASWPYARTYAHAGMVALDGEKMSKSKGNLVLVSKLLADGVHPMAVRLAVLAHHYRSDWEWTDEGLALAQERLARWQDAVSREGGPAAAQMLAEVRAAMADDLDAPAALAAVDRWVDEQLTSGGDDIGATLGATFGDDIGATFGDGIGAPGLVSRTVDALLGVRL